MANGSSSPQPGDNFRGSVLRHVTALLLIWSLLVFLGLALLAPFTEYLSDSAEGIIVGGFVSAITLVINSLFQTEATKQAARSSQTAHDAGAAAALSQPPPGQPPSAVGSDFTGAVPAPHEPIPGAQDPRTTTYP